MVDVGISVAARSVFGVAVEVVFGVGVECCRWNDRRYEFHRRQQLSLTSELPAQCLWIEACDFR